MSPTSLPDPSLKFCSRSTGGLGHNALHAAGRRRCRLNVRPQLRQRFKTGAERAIANVDLFLEMSRAYDVRGLTGIRTRHARELGRSNAPSGGSTGRRAGSGFADYHTRGKGIGVAYCHPDQYDGHAAIGVGTSARSALKQLFDPDAWR